MCMYCACFLMLEYAKTDKIRQNGQRLLLKVSKKQRGWKPLNMWSSAPYCLVGITGLEPATSRPPDACANQLR